MGLKIIGHAANGVESTGTGRGAAARHCHDRYQDAIHGWTDTLPEIKRIIKNHPGHYFSGFDEFEYAKEAIKMDAAEYLLKPINAGELKEVFERIKADLDRERDEKRNTDKLREYYMESLPVLQESFYMALLEGRVAARQIGKYAKDYQVNLSAPYYAVTVLHISTQSLPEEEREDPFLLAMAVKKYAEEQVDERWNSRFVIYLGILL